MNTSHNAQTSATSSSTSRHSMVALCVGLVSMGFVMTLWSTGSVMKNGSLETGLLFLTFIVGLAALLLALCLSVRNKCRQMEQAEHYAVPSYAEVVGTEQYHISLFIEQQDSGTSLPTYEELMERPQDWLEGTNPASQQPFQTLKQMDDSDPARVCTAGSSHRNELPRLLPLKVRPSSSPQFTLSSMEPLTPPPQYEDIAPELPHLPHEITSTVNKSVTDSAEI